MTSLAINVLLDEAAEDAAENDGQVSTDIAMRLAAEGYDLTQLDHDVALRAPALA